MRGKPLVFALLAVLLVSATASVSFAQATAQMTGTITDTSGLIVPGAKVGVTNEATGVDWEAASNASGIYSVLFLPPGSYRVDVHEEGFRAITRTGVQLQVAQAVTVDFKLEVGALTESVSVSDTAPLLDASTSAIGGVVASDKIENAPMKGRNTIAFMMLQPGVRMPRLTASQPVQESHYEFFSIAGARPDQNQFLLDGPTTPT